MTPRAVSRSMILSSVGFIVLSAVLFGTGAASGEMPFSRRAILDRFDADGDRQLSRAEKAAVRLGFGNMDVPMLPDQLFDYTKAELPAHVDRVMLEDCDSTPESNAVTNAGATLGRVLFYDKQLSRSRTVACASCHDQRAAFADPNRFSIGHQGERTRRNAMSLANLRYSNVHGHKPGFFWDERATSLEAQSLEPIQDPIEMGMELGELERRLNELPYYTYLFEAAFGSPDVSRERIAQALAQFLRSCVSMNSRFDRAAARAVLETASPQEESNAARLYAADFPDFTPEENLGKAIFMNGPSGVAEHGCAHCHVPPTFNMPRAMNNGLALRYEDRGLGSLDRPPNDPFHRSNDGKFKAPSLRNVALTAPYMHDGRFASLREVIDHYSDAVEPHENLSLAFEEHDRGADARLGLKLTARQKAALLAFLRTLTDETFISDERFSDPFLRARDDDL